MNLSEDLNFGLLILGGASLIVVVLIIFLTRNKRTQKLFGDLFRNKPEDDEEKAERKDSAASNIELNFMVEDIEKIKSELRIMNIEKEIVGYALTRLYEAEAEEKLNNNNRLLALDKYKSEMQRLDQEIEKKHMIVKLHDLEETKTELMEMFHTKLEEIGNKIENIKVTLGFSTLETEKTANKFISQPSETLLKRENNEEETSTTSNVRTKSEAEERIETIQEEVLKVLERLEQIETEERKEE